MPQLSCFRGIAINMYYSDHLPPHFHVRHGDEAAKIEIATGAILAGSLSHEPFGLCGNGPACIATSSRPTGGGPSTIAS
jgi:Domain of unknown function (DUF4160)